MASFGEELKRQRELRSISLREIADSTKINIRFLESLEGNDFKHLPGGQFNKGFVRAYATYIGLDPEETVNAYLHELALKEEQEKARTRYVPPQKIKKSGKRSMMTILVVSIVVVIIIVIAWALFLYVPENFFRTLFGR